MEKNVHSFIRLSRPSISPVQLTVKYLNALEKHKSDKTIVHNTLIYYMDRVKQDENKAVDIVFVKKLLDEGVDVNYLDGLEENALFKVFDSINIFE